MDKTMALQAADAAAVAGAPLFATGLAALGGAVGALVLHGAPSLDARWVAQAAYASCR